MVDRELPFGSVSQSTLAVTKTLDVKNSGGGVLKVTNVIVEMVSQNTSRFELASADRFDVEAGKSAPITVRLTPSVVGRAEGRLTIRFDASLTLSPITVSLTATVEAAGASPRIDTDLGTTRTLAWGTVIQSTTPVEKSFTVFNRGGSPLTISNITIEGTSLARLVTASRFDVPVNGSQTVTVALAPQTVGKLEGTLTIVSTDPNQGRLTIALTAEVKRPEDIPSNIKVLNPFNFSPLAYNVPTQATSTVQNDRGLVPLRLFDVVSDNTQVVIKSYEVNPIDPNRTGAIIAEYTARPYRATSGFVHVYSNAEESPKKILWSAKEVPLDTLGVVSALPRDGATNVSPTTSITVEFSDEVFAFGSRFAAVEVDLQPEPKKFNWQGDISVVGKRVTYRNVPLEAGTTYRFSVLSAVGRRGQELGSSREFLFSTGGSIPATGSIKGTVAFASSSEGPQGVRTDTLSAQGGRAFAVDEKTKAVVAEQVIGKGGEFELKRLPGASSTSSGRYLVYAEAPGRDQPVSVSLDQDNNGRPDPVVVTPGQSSPPVVIPVQDVPLKKEEAPGRVMLDGNPNPGNQNPGGQSLSSASFSPDSTVSIALYVDGVQELKGYSATVQFEADKLDFIGFEPTLPGSPSAPEDRPLLVGQQDGVSSVREKPVVSQEAGTVKVEGDQVKVEGKLLDGRKENAASGGGLLGILKFAAKAGQSLGGGKPVRLAAEGEAVVKVRELTLSSLDRRKTVQNAGTVQVVSQPPPPSVLIGDVNGDKVVDEGDAVLMLRFRAGLTTLTMAQQRMGDVNGDGTLDEGDVILILRLRAGLISAFPRSSKPVGDQKNLEPGRGDDPVNRPGVGRTQRGAEVGFGEARAVSVRHSSLLTPHFLRFR
ncbi:MAG: hypothetical protein A3F84_24060 [Candidatus Handelsmanbacteria bacterium RIFCSPLOWO2_12_FULL_64_10]|uniref:Dockerin domain-containing protein n=1 Tax=Handelsmanbacteria sp. (strain RIFCSPLOWO2_12_FULL_64_10) TaxID=1817868 RepID=A0A1F6C3G4_HANXR|nr:MAG: hypothetical protein A3F84_24060 [Candidatus Handelsmanbacteria bacterium RIFCSPLOWO2_12_FULL_64_10]